MAGTFQGGLGIFQYTKDGLVLIQTLMNGHTEIVRDFEWDLQKKKMITVGEDSKITLWTSNIKQAPKSSPSSSSSSASGLGKIPSPTRVDFQTLHQKKPYSKKPY